MQFLFNYRIRKFTLSQLHSFDLAFGASPSGSFGIGITLEKVGHGPNMGLPIIKEVLSNGSAFAKLACGDVLLSIGGKAIDKNAPLKSTMQSIKGAGDTFVDVTILRFHPAQSHDETLTFRLKRQPLQNLSPFIKRTAMLPTTFSSSSQSSFIGVRAFCSISAAPPAPRAIARRPLP
jgi:C-terminal processing protease CtpA/Prc